MPQTSWYRSVWWGVWQVQVMYFYIGWRLCELYFNDSDQFTSIGWAFSGGGFCGLGDRIRFLDLHLEEKKTGCRKIEPCNLPIFRIRYRAFMAPGLEGVTNLDRYIRHHNTSTFIVLHWYKRCIPPNFTLNIYYLWLLSAILFHRWWIQRNQIFYSIFFSYQVIENLYNMCYNFV